MKAGMLLLQRRARAVTSSKDAEDHARLADTLAQANERFEAEDPGIVGGLVEEARRLAAEKPSNGLLASPHGSAAAGRARVAGVVAVAGVRGVAGGVALARVVGGVRGGRRACR